MGIIDQLLKLLQSNPPDPSYGGGFNTPGKPAAIPPPLPTLSAPLQTSMRPPVAPRGDIELPPDPRPSLAAQHAAVQRAHRQALMQQPVSSPPVGTSGLLASAGRSAPAPAGAPAPAEPVPFPAESMPALGMGADLPPAQGPLPSSQIGGDLMDMPGGQKPLMAVRGGERPFNEDGGDLVSLIKRLIHKR